MKRFVLSIVLVLMIMAFGFTQDIKPNKEEAKKEAGKDGITEADKKALTDLIEKLKSDEKDDEETLAKIVELYKRIGDLLIDELNELKKTDAEIVSKILTRISTFKKSICEKHLGVFDKLNLTDFKDKKFVVFNDGYWFSESYKLENQEYERTFFKFVYGWLISKSESNIQILLPNMMVETFSLIKEPPSDWKKHVYKQIENLPSPYKFEETDFAKFCKDFVEMKIKPRRYSMRHPNEAKQSIPETCVYAYNGLLSRFTVSYIYANWALESNHIDLSYQLIQSSYLGQSNDRSIRVYPVTLVEELSGNLRWQAITRANNLAPRTEILTIWENIQTFINYKHYGIPEEHSDFFNNFLNDEFLKEIPNMIKQLKLMIEEDKNWKEPSEEEFKKMTPTEQAEYWMYKLRDHNTSQYGNPGRCNVFNSGRGLNEDKKNPAEELKKLGIDAIPILIDHMDDPRPTRCVGFWRSYSYGSYYHLFYGDVCQQIFEAISGIKIYERKSTSGTMMRDGKAADAKKKAQAWWKDYQKDECEKLLSVFDMVESTDIKDKKFIVYNTGSIYHDDDEEMGFRFLYSPGWLIGKDEKWIGILGLRFSTFYYQIDKELPSNWDDVKDKYPKDLPLPGCYKEFEFETFCNDYINNTDRKYMKSTRFFSYIRFPVIFESCLLAYWALKLDMIDTSYQLIQFAYKERKKTREYRDKSVQNIISSNLASKIRRNAMNEANEGAPRSEFIKKWELITKLPENDFLEEAKKMVELLKEMIEEEKSWKEPTEEEFKQMTTEEQVKYWMFKLRDCHSKQNTQPGGCYALGSYGFNNKEINPANKLRDLDLAAIPLLIEHMDDPRPTRCVGFWRSFSYSSYYHLFYGDVCEQIFEAISGIEIYRRYTTSSSMMRDGAASRAKKYAQEWWDALQKKGIKQYLIEDIIKGERSSIQSTSRFMKLYPDEDVVEALFKGIENAKTNDIRLTLFRILIKIDDERISEFLLNYAKKADSIGARALVAVMLHKLGRKEGLEIALAEMNTYEQNEDERGIKTLIEFLCSSKNVEAIKTLKNNFHKLDKSIKDHVFFLYRMNFRDYIRSNKVKKETDSTTDELRNEFEALLVHALDFEDQFYRGHYSYNKKYSDPRVCDLAADLLVRFYKKKYKFDITASLYSKDVQLVNVKNVWRKENNMPLLPEIAKKEVPKLSDDVVKSMINKIQNAKDDTELDSVISEIEKSGLSALQPMQKYFETLDDKNPTKDKILRMLKRLAIIVNEVRMTNSSAKPDDKLKKLMDDLVGKPLDANAIIRIIKEYIETKTDDTCGIIIDACRDADNKGFIVMFGLQKNESKLATNWVISRDLTIDGVDQKAGSGNYFRPSEVKSAETYKWFIRAFAKAADTLPSSLLTLRVTAIQQD